nr:MAG TPA: hypothetical protein [Caudoviricetes sp.]
MWLYRLKPIFSFLIALINIWYKIILISYLALTSQNMSI